MIGGATWSTGRVPFWRPGVALALAEGDRLRYVGRVAVGRAELASLDGVVPLLRWATAPCKGAGLAEVWLEPHVVVEVRYLASSQHGLRHPMFVRFRPDKRWRECTEPR